MTINTITNVGQVHLNSAIGGGQALVIKSIVLGDGIKPDTIEEAKELTSIKSSKKVAGILTVNVNGNTIHIHAPVDNIGVLEGFKIREIGINVEGANKEDVLFWYINYGEETSFMSANSTGLVRSDLNFDIVINQDSVIFENGGDDSSIFATKEYVDKEIKIIKDRVDDIDIDLSTKLDKDKGGDINGDVGFKGNVKVSESGIDFGGGTIIRKNKYGDLEFVFGGE